MSDIEEQRKYYERMMDEVGTEYRRRISDLQAENEKLRELAIDMWRFTGAACRKYPRLFDPSAQGWQTVRLNALDEFEQRMRELGIEMGA